MSIELTGLCHDLRGRIAKRRVIPFLGAGASLAGRPQTDDWERDQRDRYLPSGDELAALLAHEHAYPSDERNRSLVRVAQFVELRLGARVLFEDLRATFAGSYAPTRVHEFLAEQTAERRARDLPNPWPMILTTNYDDALERAYADAGQPYDLVTYFAERGQPGGFRHRPWGGETVPIDAPDRYRAFAPEERTVIVKLHGGIDRDDARADSFVITEDHYISYTADDVAERLPACLLGELLECHLLFLGYGLEDWNLRVFLFHLWKRRWPEARSWAIQRTVNTIDRRFWQNHGVEVIGCDLGDWVDAMRSERP